MKRIIGILCIGIMCATALKAQENLQVIPPFSLNTDIKEYLSALDPGKKITTDGVASWYFSASEKYFPLILQVKAPKKELKKALFRVKKDDKVIITKECSVSTNVAMRISFSQKVKIIKATYDDRLLELEIE